MKGILHLNVRWCIFISDPAPPSSHPTQSPANSRIAGMMKLMLYGPLLDLDKRTEEEERRQNGK